MGDPGKHLSDVVALLVEMWMFVGHKAMVLEAIRSCRYFSLRVGPRGEIGQLVGKWG